MNKEKKIVEEIITFLETLKVEEDGRHIWRDYHNDCIDRCRKALTEKYKVK